ncbi:MAG: glycoside hydrolase family 19 protein, partial [Sulfurimonas sp.]|nr:glycoside hydrolase family 19 protein [Sulfurimonas sp.]
DTILNILEQHKERLDNYEQLKQHYNNQKTRIEKLEFFSKCRSIDGFPTSDSVYHFNPIMMVAEFGREQLITKEMLNAICPNAGSNQELLNALNKYCPQYQINTPLRIAHFLAQTAHESGCFQNFGEGIYYRLSTALATWPSRNNDINKLPLDGRYLKQPDLFNAVYGTRNGNIAGTDDGYNFRGRGLIQLTGRTNYTNYQASHNAKNSDDIQDFINNPSLIATNINYAVESACWFWDSNQLNLLADQNVTDVTSVTRKINGGTNGLTERQEFFDAVKKVLGI